MLLARLHYPPPPFPTGRRGQPHKRLLFLDITEPTNPYILWQEGASKGHGSVKDKDRIRLVEIITIVAGKSGEVFARSGKDADSGKYMSFQCEGRTLDCEFPTTEAATFIFKKFADLFQAYATAQGEKLKGEAVSIRIAAIVDGGVTPKPKAKPDLALKAAAAQAALHTPGTFHSGGAHGHGLGGHHGGPHGGPHHGTPHADNHAFPYQLTSPAPVRGGAGQTPNYRL